MTMVPGFTAKRPHDDVWDDQSEMSSGYSSVGVTGSSTAQTSAVPTPVYTPTDQLDNPVNALDMAADLAATTAQQSSLKRMRVKGPYAAGAALESHNSSTATDTRQEYERRRDMFICTHAKTFQGVLPEKNHVQTMLNSLPPNSKPREVMPFKRLSQPKLITGGTMKEYQLTGLSFMAYMYENGQNCILADEMGLGKTLQTLSLIAYIKEQHGIQGPHLLVCPLSVLGSWVGEINRWLPSYNVLRFHGPQSERARLKYELNKSHPDLVVTTYESYTAESAWFKHRRWSLCVLDEGHKIKNHESMAAQALQGIGAHMRLILSGTPLQNNLIELWSMLHFLMPQLFTQATLRRFKEAFDLQAGLYDQDFLKKSQALLELIMLRRTKEGVRDQLSVPPREEMTLYVPLSPAQRFWYMRLLTRADTVTLNEVFSTDLRAAAGVPEPKRGRKSKSFATDSPTTPVIEEVEAEDEDDGQAQVRENLKQAMATSKGGEGNAWMKMMNLLMQLRKCCNHPYLLPNAESEPFEVAEHLVAASSKLVLLDKLLADVVPKGEKVLIFSGFTRMLDILEDFMGLRGYKYARLDGGTSRPRRALDIKLFQQKKSPYQCYLISTRAGGLGINLTAATTVVLIDQDWNPQADIQAISRAHRIGQTKKVNVYRFVCQDSVEEQALTRLRKKLYLSAKVMGSMKNAADRPADEQIDDEAAAEVEQNEDDAPKMTRGELAGILRGGAGALARWESEEGDAFQEFKRMSFNDLRERGRQRDERKEFGIKLEAGEELTDEQRAQLEREEAEAEKMLLQGREAVQARKFEGATYKATNLEIREEWDQMVARSRDSRTVLIDGHAVLKETLDINGKDGGAVKTITSDPNAAKKLAGPKRKRKRFDHEDFCMVCKDGGEVYQCASCPRSCHGPCSGHTQQELDAMLSFFCAQHNCTICRRTTQEAGGLLFRCQCCHASYCEDCLPPDEIEPVGDVLPEFLLLGCGKRTQAYFIRCADCIEYYRQNPEARQRFEAEQVSIRKQLAEQGIDV
ncbi:hypothetical protein OIO90_000595 [Microbotryomycetes sp. JL221]|nr:hypothetical protein OIO90_000595 [Microbotryomycetes sp. JL221]